MNDSEELSDFEKEIKKAGLDGYDELVDKKFEFEVKSDNEDRVQIENSQYYLGRIDAIHNLKQRVHGALFETYSDPGILTIVATDGTAFSFINGRWITGELAGEIEILEG